MAKTVAVVGLGYVGLPLALAFGRVLPTIGFDVSAEKLQAYKTGYWRIDYHICTPEIAASIKALSVFTDVWYSDHAPVSAMFER